MTFLELTDADDGEKVYIQFEHVANFYKIDAFSEPQPLINIGPSPAPLLQP